MSTLLLLLLVAASSGCGWHEGLPAEGPAQPIAFSHALHAGRLAIDCRYCHSRVERSPEANIPSVARCVACHAGVKEERTTEAMRQVLEHWEDRRPIAWTKVHDLPDHVHMDHGAHMRAGVSCERCHGQVEQMERVRQVEEFEMIWCVNCHREEGADFDCLVCHK